MGSINRRAFLKTSAGLAGATLLPGGVAHAAPAQPSGQELNIIGPRDGFAPEVGTLVSMLNWTRSSVVSSVEGLTLAQLDYLHDAQANTIGALLLHLAATERHYQIHTFEGKEWGDWDEQTRKQWDAPGGLGDQGRRQIKGHELPYYLDTLREMRERTLAELRIRDDAWLRSVDRGWGWGPTNNYGKWFHVCEHESHHNGQIRWIKGRLPGASTSE